MKGDVIPTKPIVDRSTIFLTTCVGEQMLVTTGCTHRQPVFFLHVYLYPNKLNIYEVIDYK